MEKHLPESKIQEHVQKVTSKIVPRLTEFLQKNEPGKISFEIDTDQRGVKLCKMKTENKF